MDITFHISHLTKWGENLFVTGSIAELGEWDEDLAIPMGYIPDYRWEKSIKIEANSGFCYKYLIKDDKGNVTKEWGEGRCFAPKKSSSSVQFEDTFISAPHNLPYYTSFFSNIFCQKGEALTRPPAASSPKKRVELRIYVPVIKPEDQVIICGGNDHLGGWNPFRGLPLERGSYPEWKISLDPDKISGNISFKFLIAKKNSGNVVEWEGGNNRVLYIPAIEKNEEMIFSDFQFDYANNPWKGAGFAIPVFALRSNRSNGIGDFADLIPAVDWAAKCGMKVIQLLPINDTTMTHSWVDSYPYNANSIYALHPIYLNLGKMGTLEDEELMQNITNRSTELNQLAEIDYEEVEKLKWSFFREIFEQNGKQILKSKAYEAFYGENSKWLKPYALFCYMRDRYATPDFSKWEQYTVYSEEIENEFFANGEPINEEIAIHLFLQYHLHIQLKESTEYARSSGVIFKGDIPIGISRHSVEAWVEPELFFTNCQAGAPPDNFSVTGQNWGFPTYNWEMMQKDGLSWWKNRFKKMADYFDAYRIDHVLGFFRIWEIPITSVQGLLGYFSPALPLSRQELVEKGFYINQHHTRPYLKRWVFDEIFKGESNKMIADFFVQTGDDDYAFAPSFDTQKKVEAYFLSAHCDHHPGIKEKLFSLHNEVLFIEDPHNQECYHPRISAQFSFAYRALNDGEKYAFNRIYDDFFFVRNNEFWKEMAMNKLPHLAASTQMLTCAEDLGMIPTCVPEVMEQLQILSLEIERMPKEVHHAFANVASYPYLSVCSPSTHDMSPIREWWKEDPEMTSKYYREVAQQQGETPAECPSEVCQKIIERHLYSPSILAIFPLQDLFSINENIRRRDGLPERINIPANPRHYWRYRIHLNLEELIANKDFANQVKTLLSQSGRL